MALPRKLRADEASMALFPCCAESILRVDGLVVNHPPPPKSRVTYRPFRHIKLVGIGENQLPI